MPDDRRDGRSASSDEGSTPTVECPDGESAASTLSTDGGSAESEGSPEQPTVTIGSEGYRPDEAADVDDANDARTTAGLENAIPDVGGGFDWRGWLLVAAIVVSFLVVPIAILLRPLRIVGFRTTYLVLPLLPALVLGATAVWVAVRSRQVRR